MIVIDSIDIVHTYTRSILHVYTFAYTHRSIYQSHRGNPSDQSTFHLAEIENFQAEKRVFSSETSFVVLHFESSLSPELTRLQIA